jgi:hypothetical protein
MRGSKNPPKLINPECFEEWIGITTSSKSSRMICTLAQLSLKKQRVLFSTKRGGL